MRLSEFDYSLPKELIAQYPLLERDSARLLVVDRRLKTIEHRFFRDLIDYFDCADILVLNDTKVLPCRLYGRRQSGGRVELLLLRQKNGPTFEVLIKPARLRLKEKIIFEHSLLKAEVSAKNEITFFGEKINEVYGLGVMPLPPYIKRKSEDLDDRYYQTVYAAREGAVAAPTAGLHFSEGMLERVRAAGVEIVYLTLHIGQATFKPIKCEEIGRHKMGKEYFSINPPSLKKIKEARGRGGRIFAVGTTSCRALESYASSGLSEGETDLFILPGYQFKLLDCLVTNFHLPRTTLFMLVCAFAGRELIFKAYQQAIEKRYRFYSYGDAMLIL